jgi:hypothetical protein
VFPQYATAWQRVRNASGFSKNVNLLKGASTRPVFPDRSNEYLHDCTVVM